MTLINLSLLAGLGLAVIPVVLHLILRSRPKRIEFPALRLLEARRTANARRMKLRHLLLLLLRMSVLVVVVLALTRPYLPPARYGLAWHEWLVLLGVSTATAVGYRWLSQRASVGESDAFRLRERIAKLRATTLLLGLLALLLAVGIPWGFRVRGEVRSPDRNVAAGLPVAAAFVFDTSISMSYRHESLTRLEQAQQFATGHLQTLPSGSRVAVVSAAPSDGIIFQADLAGAQSKIDALRTDPQIEPLNRILVRVIEAHRGDQQLVRDDLESSDSLFSRELFIFTDLSQSAWSLPDDSGLRDLLEEHEWLQVFLVDVSVANPVNFSLRNLKLSSDSIVAGHSIDLSIDVVRTESTQTFANVEMYLLTDDGEETRGASPVHVQLDNESARARMLVPAGEDAEFLRGIVRLTSSDPLQADDRLYFSLGVQPRPRVLLIADRFDDTFHLMFALEAGEGGPSSQSACDCTFVRFSQLHSQLLRSFDVVCLVNCRQPKPDVWKSLHRFVDHGGALLTVVGGAQTADYQAWSIEESELVLPARPLLSHRFPGKPASLTCDTGHPVTRAFDDNRNDLTELLGIPVRRCWIVDPFPDAGVIMSYTDRNSRPALIERRVGRGRSLMLTTAVDYTPDPARQWNELPASYAFMLLADGIMQYLSGAAEQRRNFESGAPVELQLPADRRFESYVLRRPGPRQTSVHLQSGQRYVLIDDATEPGHYRAWARDEPGEFRNEFAVNMDDTETDLTLITSADLEGVLGKDRFSVVKNRDELEETVHYIRLGIEVFPVLVGLLVILFCSEHLMANYFYDQESVPDAVQSA